MICFGCFGAYMMFSPYTLQRHDIIATACQVQIFATLLSGVVLNSSRTIEDEREFVGYVLVGMMTVPLCITGLVNTPFGTYALDKNKRTKVTSPPQITPPMNCT